METVETLNKIISQIVNNLVFNDSVAYTSVDSDLVNSLFSEDGNYIISAVKVYPDIFDKFGIGYTDKGLRYNGIPLRVTYK